MQINVSLADRKPAAGGHGAAQMKGVSASNLFWKSPGGRQQRAYSGGLHERRRNTPHKI